MALINLATKYASKIATAFAANSFIKGNTGAKFDFTGARTVKVYTLQTVPEREYQRKGLNRYGIPEEIGETVQELTMKRDMAFNGIVDKGNEADQPISNKAGEWLQEELRAECVPNADKYAIGQFVKFGHSVGISETISKNNVNEKIAEAAQYFDDHSVPESDRLIYITAEVFKFIKLSPEFVGNDTLGTASIVKGQVGEVQGMNVIKVPTSYLPSGCYFLCTYKGSVMMPYKLSETKIHTDPPGLSGSLIEGRHYYDAFVLEAKKDGVYACVQSALKLAAPNITCANPGTDTLTITADGAEEIYYTVDGSDPRFSDTKMAYSAPIVTTSWVSGEKMKVKAVSYASKKFTSDVVEKTFTKA